MKELYDEIEMPLTYVLYAMEKEGVIVQKERIKALRRAAGRKDRCCRTAYLRYGR